MEEKPIKKEKITSQSDAGGEKKRKSAMLSESAHTLANAVNQKRKRDTEMLEKMRSTLSLQMEKICTKVEQYMYNMYEKRDQTLNKQLKELSSFLEKIAKIETELALFKRELANLYQEMETS